eukprot:792123-Pyramimonas_sp.AAC.1
MARAGNTFKQLERASPTEVQASKHGYHRAPEAPWKAELRASKHGCLCALEVFCQFGRNIA